jgi:RimJ/RimL family protein N-acetyltransferase
MAANGTGLPVVGTRRLTIRPLVDDDERACRSVLAVPDEDAYRRWFTWAVAAPAALADLHQPPYGERAVVLAVTGDLIGLIGLVPALGPFAQLDGAPPGGPWTPELGLYWALAPDQRGHGYATEAAAALCRALFAALNPKRLIAMTEATNHPSQAVMRRLGMTMLTNPHDEPEWLQVVGVLETAPRERPDYFTAPIVRPRTR